MESPNKGAEQLSAALQAEGMTPYALDKELDWTIGQSSKYLRGQRKPDTQRAWQLWERFQIAPPTWDEPATDAA